MWPRPCSPRRRTWPRRESSDHGHNNFRANIKHPCAQQVFGDHWGNVRNVCCWYLFDSIPSRSIHSTRVHASQFELHESTTDVDENSPQWPWALGLHMDVTTHAWGRFKSDSMSVFTRISQTIARVTSHPIIQRIPKGGWAMTHCRSMTSSCRSTPKIAWSTSQPGIRPCKSSHSPSQRFTTSLSIQQHVLQGHGKGARVDICQPV